jgi:uncharacterized protein (DUF983 family)
MSTKPSRLHMLWRGLTKRCARCGSGHLFHGWFKIVDTCPRCGLKFEHEEGYWTGAIAVNTVIIGAIFAAVFITALILTVPDVPWGALLVVVVPIMALGPLFFYPFSKTIWVAIDLAFLQPLGINLGEG